MLNANHCAPKELFGDEARKMSRIQNLCQTTEHGKFRAAFGTSFEVCEDTWHRLSRKEHLNSKAKPKHSLWTLPFLCECGTEENLCFRAGGVDPKTFRQWVFCFVSKMATLSKEVIDWRNRFLDWDGLSSSLVSIDCIDFRIKEPWPFCPIWWSHKHDGPALECEVAVSMCRGDTVAVHGPFPGAINDRAVFDLGTSGNLLPGETVEADSFYSGRDAIVLPRCAKTSLHRKEKSQVRGRGENVNARPRCFKILENECRHDISNHGMHFMCVVTIIQLGFDNGGELCDVPFQANCDQCGSCEFNLTEQCVV